jgi:hypothetical protein
MAIAAPILPPAPDELDLPEEVREELRASWTSWWTTLRDEVRAHPPDHDTQIERLVLARFLRGLLSLTQRYGSFLRPLLRAGFSRAFENLIEQEEAQAAPIRRLGLKLLGRAVEVLGELFEATLAFAPPALVFDVVEQPLPDTDEAIAHYLDEPGAALLRLELSVFVAFDLAQEASLEEFAVWARRANMAAQRAAPIMAMLSSYSSAWAPIDMSADVVLAPPAFDRVVELVENPPAPSTKLRELLRRGTS